MSSPLAKVKSGDDLVIPAEAYNAFVDAANAVKSLGRTGGGSAGGQTPDPDVVLIKNASGADVPLCGVLGIDGVLFVPTSDAQRSQLKLTWHLKGIAPTLADHRGKFVIAAEPIRNGDIGRAYISGVCPVMLEISSATDTFADVKASSAELKTSGSGSAQILWKEAGTGSGKLGIVRLGNPQPDRIVQLTQVGGTLGANGATASSWTYDLMLPGSISVLATGLAPSFRPLPTWTNAATYGLASFFGGAWHLITAFEPLHDESNCDDIDWTADA